MNASEPIVVNPVSSTSEKARNAASAAAQSVFRAPAYEFKAAKVAKDAVAKATEAACPVAQPTIIDDPNTTERKANPVAGAVQTVAGGALMLVGIPMLILPGPGIAAIAGGAAIAAGGIKKLRRK